MQLLHVVVAPFPPLAMLKRAASWRALLTAQVEISASTPAGDTSLTIKPPPTMACNYFTNARCLVLYNGRHAAIHIVTAPFPSLSIFYRPSLPPPALLPTLHSLPTPCPTVVRLPLLPPTCPSISPITNRPPLDAFPNTALIEDEH